MPLGIQVDIEQLISLLVSHISKLAERTECTEFKEALCYLAAWAEKAIQPQLDAIDTWDKPGRIDSIKPQLAALYMTLKSAEDIISKWTEGKSHRKKSEDRFVVDDHAWKTSKFQSEIEGIRESITVALGDLGNAMGRPVDASELAYNFGSLQISPQMNPEPWALCMSEVEYELAAPPRTERALPVGYGSFGVVYKAKYQGLKVAVKCLENPDGFMNDPEKVERFRREAGLLFKMHHKNVIAFVGAVSTDAKDQPCYVLVTEMLTVTLKEYVDELRADDFETRHTVILGLAQGLAYLHSMKVEHRDIKHTNFMMDANGSPKFIDFGLAKQKMTPVVSSCWPGGTPNWMAPELDHPDGRSSLACDVYSFGLVMMFVLSGEEPDEYYIGTYKKIRALRQLITSCKVDVELAACCTEWDAPKRPTSALLAMSLLNNTNLCTAQNCRARTLVGVPLGDTQFYF
jgi:tRNA A-37 threonylcarbamoyl transferase component Bud32